MIKLIGIDREPILMTSIDAPPMTYKKYSARPLEKGVFQVQVFKLKYYNSKSGEAFYVKQKNQKQKAKEQDFSNFLYSSKNPEE